MDKSLIEFNKPSIYFINNLHFLVFMLVFGQYVQAQKIYFPKRNYADSLSLQKAIPELADKVIATYLKQPVNEKTDDNLFRLYLCAVRYPDMDKLLRKMNYEQTGDSTSAGPIAFHYQVYSATLQINSKAEAFDADYTRCFKEKYTALSPEHQGTAEFVFNQNVRRASYAKNRSQRNLLKPGKKERIPIESTYYTARQLQKGSRIIIVFGINKNANEQVNYGTGRDVSDESINDAKEKLIVNWASTSTIKIPVLR